MDIVRNASDIKKTKQIQPGDDIIKKSRRCLDY